MDFHEKPINPQLLITGNITEVTLLRSWGIEILGLTLYPNSSMRLEEGTTYLSQNGEKKEGAVDQTLENDSSDKKISFLAIRYY